MLATVCLQALGARASGRAGAGDFEQPLADLLGVAAEVVEPRQLRRLSSPKTRSKSGVAR